MLKIIKNIFQLNASSAQRKSTEGNVSPPIDSRQVGLFDSVVNGWYQQETDELYRGFHLSHTDNFLDIGAGSGMACLFAAQRNCDVTYTDINELAIKEIGNFLDQKGFSNHQGRVSDTTYLPLESSSYDKVVSIEVLEHMISPEAGLAEMVRVGRPGAKYLLTVPGHDGELVQKTFAPESYFSEPNHVHIFSRKEFEELVESAGLEIESYSLTGFFWFFWMSLYWIEQKNIDVVLEGAALDKVSPPYFESQDDWANLWKKVLQNPHSAELRKSLDTLLPKNQIIVATKPL
jgi:ubiquinone/menaquinone biosynthesis C-methylase UbiE